MKRSGTLVASAALAASSSWAVASLPRLPAAAIARGYTHRIFKEDFSHFDISRDGTSGHNWYQELWFQHMIDWSNFQLKDGHLVIVAPDGLDSAQITTLPRDDSKALAFGYGYFQASMRWKFHSDGGSPFKGATFWLESVDAPHPRHGFDEYCEIDVVEPGPPNQYHMAVHRFYGSGKSTEEPLTRHDYRADTSKWHRYGVLREPGLIRFYLDGKEISHVVPPKVCEGTQLFIIVGAQKGADSKQGTQAVEIRSIEVYD